MGPWLCLLVSWMVNQMRTVSVEFRMACEIMVFELRRGRDDTAVGHVLSFLLNRCQHYRVECFHYIRHYSFLISDILIQNGICELAP